jgi:hypothetical protein
VTCCASLSFNFTLFGESSGREPWGWQLAGHHLALNCVIVDGQMVILFADEERMRRADGFALAGAAAPGGGLRPAEGFRDALGEVAPGRPAAPRRRLAEIERHLDDTHFCWIGETDGEHPFYYRIQSPVIMIEFDEHAGVFLSNEEPERFHIHTIVRTPNGNDYGMDLLRMHYAQAHPGRRPGA